MPRKSLKRCVEEELEHLHLQREWKKVCRFIFEDDDEEEKDDADGGDGSSLSSGDELIDLAVSSACDQVLCSRHLFREPRCRQPQDVFVRNLQEPTNDDELPWLTEDEFLEKHRMRRDSFQRLLCLVQGHTVFSLPSEKGRKQRPVAHQLMVLMNCLGCAGSGANDPRQRQTFGIGRGTAQLHRRRCIEAIRSLKKDVVHWPDVEERDEIAKRNTTNCMTPNCTAIADGTSLPLQKEPQSLDAPDHSGRKHQHSLTMMVVNDDNKKMRCFHAGFPGSAHDNRVCAATPLFSNAADCFGNNCHLIGDSAFENSSSVVASFKAPRGHSLGWEQERFDTHMGRLRVASEHTIGMLKARFPWLRCIPMLTTDDPRSVRRILKAIETCVIPHNLLVDLEEELPADWHEGWEVIDVVGDPVLEAMLQQNEPKDSRRQRTLDHLRDCVCHSQSQARNDEGCCGSKTVAKNENSKIPHCSNANVFASNCQNMTH